MATASLQYVVVFTLVEPRHNWRERKKKQPSKQQQQQQQQGGEEGGREWVTNVRWNPRTLGKVRHM